MRMPPALTPSQESALRLDTIKRTKLTPAQHQALLSARDRGSATAHLSGMYDWGGWGGTRTAMQRKGLLDSACRMTDFGRRVIDYYAPLPSDHRISMKAPPAG